MNRPGSTRPAVGARGAVGILCTLLALSGCQSGAAAPTGSKAAPAGSSVLASVVSTALPRAPYIGMVDMVAAQRAKVWVEVDLVKAWETGPQRYADVLNIAVKLAARRGVVGIKIADELGYHDGLDTPERARAFLAQASRDIRSRLPGTKILVDMVVPQFGCLAWASEQAERLSCANSAAETSPAATIDAVDTYLAAKTFDVFDLSAGLLDQTTYRAWGTTRDQAMLAVWKEAVRRQWGALVTLQARKAMAHPGPYQGTAAQAEADLHTFVDIPLANGAKAVDIWAWRQMYQGSMYRLYDPGLRTNPAWLAVARLGITCSRTCHHRRWRSARRLTSRPPPPSSAPSSWLRGPVRDERAPGLTTPVRQSRADRPAHRRGLLAADAGRRECGDGPGIACPIVGRHRVGYCADQPRAGSVPPDPSEWRPARVHDSEVPDDAGQPGRTADHRDR